MQPCIRSENTELSTACGAREISVEEAPALLPRNQPAGPKMMEDLGLSIGKTKTLLC